MARWMLFLVVLVASNLATGYAVHRLPPKLAVQPETANVMNAMYKLPGPFIVILGDSITAAAPLPVSVCGLLLINAGKSGSRTSTFIPFAEEMNAYNLSPSLIVITVGVNDAIPAYHSEFNSAYHMLLDRLPRAPIALATLSPADLTMDDAKRLDPATLQIIDRTIRATAVDRNTALIDLSKLTLETRDGLHPTDASYPIWTSAIVSGIENAMKCKSVSR